MTSESRKLSRRELARKYKVHRRTVRQALESAEAPEPKAPERRAPSLDPYKAIIRQWLIDDKDVHKKTSHRTTNLATPY
jgi:transposase